LREAVARSTLADANEARDWRISHELAQLLIRRARRLSAAESLAVDLDNTVYALDSTTIDLCLSMFPWAHFRLPVGRWDSLRGADGRGKKELVALTDGFANPNSRGKTCCWT